MRSARSKVSRSVSSSRSASRRPLAIPTSENRPPSPSIRVQRATARCVLHRRPGRSPGPAAVGGEFGDEALGSALQTSSAAASARPIRQHPCKRLLVAVSLGAGHSEPGHTWIVPDELEVRPGLQISADDFQWRFSRASGPGGQGVNTTDSRVQLSYDLASCPSPTAAGPGRASPPTRGRRHHGRRLRAAQPVPEPRISHRAARRPAARSDGARRRPRRRRTRPTRSVGRTPPRRQTPASSAQAPPAGRSPGSGVTALAAASGVLWRPAGRRCLKTPLSRSAAAASDCRGTPRRCQTTR